MTFDYSKFGCLVHECNHHSFESVKVVPGQRAHYHQGFFLEAWMSVKDPNAGNDHMVILEVYKCLEGIQHAQRFVFFLKKKVIESRVTSNVFSMVETSCQNIQVSDKKGTFYQLYIYICSCFITNLTALFGN